MESEEGKMLPSDGLNQEYRVHVTSKKQVTEQINKYKNILNVVFDRQPDIEEETKRSLQQELLSVGHSQLTFYCYMLYYE